VRFANDSIFDDLRRRPLGIYDVGARGGPPLSSYVFGDLLALVLCEPDIREHRHLRAIRGFRDLRLDHRLIGDVIGTATLNVTRKPGGSSVLEPDGRSNDRHEVIRRDVLPMTTIDAIVSETGVRCEALKIDVQGADLQVLRGCSDLPYCIRIETTGAASGVTYAGQSFADEIDLHVQRRGYALTSDRRLLTDSAFAGDLVYSRIASPSDSTEYLRWLLAHYALGADREPNYRCPPAWQQADDLLRTLTRSLEQETALSGR
jgi:FkbM family methyltransferase